VPILHAAVASTEDLSFTNVSDYDIVVDDDDDDERMNFNVA